MKFFIIHGSFGSPNENWFPWLKNELEEQKHTVIMPTFPTPEGQSLNSWNKVFDKYLNDIDGDTILIGHSLGCAYILNLLEQVSVKAAFLVSGWIGSLSIPEYDDVNYSFTDRDFNFDKIKQNCNQFIIFQSDNDKYVTVDKGKELAKKLDTGVILVENAGHFNTESGYIKFKLLLEKINEIVK